MWPLSRFSRSLILLIRESGTVYVEMTRSLIHAAGGPAPLTGLRRNWPSRFDILAIAFTSSAGREKQNCHNGRVSSLIGAILVIAALYFGPRLKPSSRTHIASQYQGEKTSISGPNAALFCYTRAAIDTGLGPVSMKRAVGSRRLHRKYPPHVVDKRPFLRALVTPANLLLRTRLSFHRRRSFFRRVFNVVAPARAAPQP
jgi:hypothetical protein